MNQKKKKDESKNDQKPWVQLDIRKPLKPISSSDKILPLDIITNKNLALDEVTDRIELLKTKSNSIHFISYLPRSEIGWIFIKYPQCDQNLDKATCILTLNMKDAIDFLHECVNHHFIFRIENYLGGSSNYICITKTT
jgi:hypothetical protein